MYKLPTFRVCPAPTIWPALFGVVKEEYWTMNVAPPSTSMVPATVKLLSEFCAVCIVPLFCVRLFVTSRSGPNVIIPE